ncbi:MAG: BamA/TamA family outer membrane protein [Cyclobacteriaceae bacterium]|nr:BamA/TamA family outer membrane protein [Cyclobacteriaceae bacterium]
MLSLLPGCMGTRHLKEGEKLVYKQRIEPKKISSSSMQDLFVMENNKKFLGLPIHLLVQFYYIGEKNFKPEKLEQKIEKVETKFDNKISKSTSQKKIINLEFKKRNKTEALRTKLENGNILMKWGEPITVFDSTKLQLTIERLQDFLFNNGYFLNKVSAETFPVGNKKVNITYTLFPGPQYTLDTILYKIPDTIQFNLIQKSKKSSLLQEGSPYLQDNFSKERERIDILFKNNGYYDFSRQYVEFDVDTSHRQGHKIAVLVQINDPAKRGYHKKFTIDEVHFTTDAGVNPPSRIRTREYYRGTEFEYFERLHSTRILSQRIFIHPGELYSRERTFETQRQLANLDNFKFVNVNFDTVDGKFIARIFTNPLDRYQWSNEVGLSVTQGFPGPYYSLSLKKRNIFRGLENFEISGRIGYEGVASATESNNAFQSIDAGLNASITFPQFIFPFKEETRYKFGRLNPRTRALVGVNYTDRPEYIRSATTFNYGYSWENRRIRRFDLTLANLSVINSKTDSAFQQLLDDLFINEGSTLFRTFEPSFVSSMLFSMAWNHGNYGNQDANSTFLRWSVESGGTFQDIFQFPIVERQGLQQFQYLRLTGDFRSLIVLDKKTILAERLNVGVGYSYEDPKVLPYEKYFFAGGSNSVRAWRPRRLGPGSFRPPLSENPEGDGLFNYQNEQPGEILLEGSVELRRKLFGFFEGAVFLDAGNVWTFQPRTISDSEGNVIENGNSQFRLKEFYKEFGIGTGFGFRFNFSFLILRFDVGIKVYDPARLEGDRFVLDKAKFFRPFGVDREPVIFNVGVGFPF